MILRSSWAFQSLPVIAVLLACAALKGADEDPAEDLAEIRTREVYVPYAEFLKVAGKDPNATLMTLDEYRALVALATARDAVPKPISLPPVESSLAEVVYNGVASETAARFEAAFKLSIAGDPADRKMRERWIRCELGPALPSLGAITLDNAPAWVVADKGRLFLLARGPGLHTGTLTFSLPAQNEEDVIKLSGPLLKSATSVLNLTVPGRAVADLAAINAPNGSASPGIDSAYDKTANSTRFTMPAGSRESFILKWKRKYDVDAAERGGRNPLLLCEQQVSYLPERASPVFRWNARVTIARFKTDELRFAEPPGGRIVRLSGPNIHSWQREGNVLRILLDRPQLGTIELEADGVVPVSPGAFDLGCPELQNAWKDTRVLALFAPPEGRLNLEAVQGFRELALNEAPVPALPGGELARVFLLEKSGAKNTVRVSPQSTVFDIQSVLNITADDKQVWMRAVMSVQPELGRLYAFRLDVPAPWTLSGIREREPVTKGARKLGIRPEMFRDGDTEFWLMSLVDSADLQNPLELDLLFKLRDAGIADKDWQNLSLTLGVPSVAGARRTAAWLGICVPPSIDVTIGNTPAWRTAEPQRLRQLGISDAMLRAGLESETAGSPVQMELVRKKPRGTYDMVTHVLTVEREAWVRADTRIAIVDHSLDELLVHLPADAKEPLQISGEDIKEIAAGDDSTQRRVRFNQPWRGVRMLSIEYRAPLAADSDVPIPNVRITSPFATKDSPFFDGNRRIVFQSAGAVELSVKAGESLAVAPLEDTPEFARAFRNGRALLAYAFRSGEALGTYRTHIYERSEVLRSVVRELNLKTVIDASGISRTHAVFLLSYSRDQYVPLKLPAEAKVVALAVDGESVAPVKGSMSDVISIPLPPRTFASVEIVYERKPGALGLFGTWRETGPDLLGIPTGVTRWNVYYPASYDVSLKPCNLASPGEKSPEFFALSFWERLAGGHWPRWTAWERRSPPDSFTLDFNQARPQQAQQLQPAAGALKALESKQLDASTARERSVGGMAIPEGAMLQAGKLGGNPVIVLAYRDANWSRFASRSIFLIAGLIGLALAHFLSPRACARYAVAGLLIGTVLPPALDWQSPNLAVPFCEGLSLVALVCLASFAWRWIGRRTERRSQKKLARGAALLALIAAGVAQTALAGESDPVLIPFLPNEVKTPDSTPETRKVYVPKARFIELMNKAHPEKIDDEAQRNVPAGISHALGSGRYALTVSGELYRIKGKLEFHTFDPKGWAKLPLNFGSSQIQSVLLDGNPASVAHDAGVPFIQVQGEGAHTIEFELQGKLMLSAGRAQLHTRLIGAATQLVAHLPAGVEVDARNLPGGAWMSSVAAGGTQQCEINLGGGGELNLAWRSADIRAKGASQLSSRSYTRLQLDAEGYAVTRAEQVSIEGAGVDHLSFQVSGNWEIAEVNAAELAEWTLTGEGGARKLQLWFQKPLNASLIMIYGWTRLGNDSAQVAGMSLEGALRQEGFIGLQHGDGRRFNASSLEALKRASAADLSSMFKIPAENLPDRLYHFHEPALMQTVAAEGDPTSVNIETHIVGLVKTDRLLVSVRSRYSATGRPPLRHEVPLPADWTVRTVTCNAMRTWEIAEAGGKRTLVVYFTSRATSGTELMWSAEQSIALPKNERTLLQLPQPRASGDGRQTESIAWVLASDAALSLLQHGSTTMSPLPLNRAPAWVRLDGADAYHFAYQSAKPESKLAVQVTHANSLASATLVSFIRAAEEHIQVNSRCRFIVSQSGRDRFQLKLPPGARLVSLEARNLRSREISEQESGSVVTVLLQSAVTGEQIFDLAYRIARKPEESVSVKGILIGDDNMQRVEQFVGLLQVERGLIAIESSPGLTKAVDGETLPFVPAGISNYAISQVFIADQPWSLVLKPSEDLKVDAGTGAEISLAVIKTVIADDGRIRSIATYTVRNRARQFLSVAMPKDAVLWGVVVGGQPTFVSHKQAGGRDVLLIPIQRMELTDLATDVSLIYENGVVNLPAALTTLTPLAPEVLETPVVETYWQLFAPEDYDVSRTGGNVKDVANNVMLGGKLSATVDEVERLLKLNDAAESSYTRRKVLRSISRKQQELSDNATELERNWTAAEYETRRFDVDDLQAQTVMNSGARSKAQSVQQRLKAIEKDIEDAVASGADLEQQQAFMDAYGFLGNGWRAGSKYKEQPEARKPLPGEVPLAELWSVRPFSGFRKGDVPPPAPQRVDTALKPIPAGAGMREDSDRIFGAEIPTAELRVPEAGRVYTFRRVEGHPELTVRLRSQSSSWRMAARVSVLALAAGFWFLRRRKNSAV